MKTNTKTKQKPVRILPKAATIKKTVKTTPARSSVSNTSSGRMVHKVLRVSDETLDILKTVKKAAKCHTWNETLETILATVEKLKKRPRLPVLHIPWGQRFMRIDERNVARITALKLGETTNRAIYEAARIYLAKTGS